MNLLLNALQSCAKGGRVRLGLAVREDAAVITVQDTGCGIPPERLETIFESFLHANGERNRNRGVHRGRDRNRRIEWPETTEQRSR